MHINRLRLLGFKSFVEPTELVIEKGLTGVVGPNGCGKSNLLEALRWVMGETSHKSMRAAAMDDVIFSGTATRPARNTAEVTIFIDNADRQAPAEFNAHDTLEVTRRIEREAGSAFRINGRDVRARDVRILFEDAATGARSPALVRQGQIGELVNAKPEQRRRILEDAAGIAGLHSRRHEAELRLKAAEGNLARIDDILGQLTSQIESLKRQARQARRPAVLGSLVFLGEALFLAVVPYAGGLITIGAAMAAVGICNGFGNVVMITVFQRWAPPSLLGRLTGLLMLASFGVFPISVALGALVVHNYGPALFFPLAAAVLAAAILAGLSQRSWRDFGAAGEADSHVQRDCWHLGGAVRPAVRRSRAPLGADYPGRWPNALQAV